MQTIATLYKQTKTGLSTFRFVKCDDGSLYMFGGITPKCINFTSMKECKSAINQWRRYGYSFTKPQAKPVAKKFEAKHVDPWSEMPADMQQDLWSLPCAV